MINIKIKNEFLFSQVLKGRKKKKKERKTCGKRKRYRGINKQIKKERKLKGM